jgi:hypothetical protein
MLKNSLHLYDKTVTDCLHFVEINLVFEISAATVEMELVVQRSRRVWVMTEIRHSLDSSRRTTTT